MSCKSIGSCVCGQCDCKHFEKLQIANTSAVSNTCRVTSAHPTSTQTKDLVPGSARPWGDKHQCKLRYKHSPSHLAVINIVYCQTPPSACSFHKLSVSSTADSWWLHADPQPQWTRQSMRHASPLRIKRLFDEISGLWNWICFIRGV